jgi:hypothetical protein
MFVKERRVIWENSMGKQQKKIQNETMGLKFAK